MMRSLKVVMLSSALLLSPAAFAADLLVNTFLQSRPFKGVELELNGKLVGETGALGEAKATLDAGRHELRLLKNGIPLADYAFDLAAGENAELSITFTNFDTPPDFALETYAEGEGVDVDATGTIGGDVMAADGQPIAGATVGVAEATGTTLTNDNGVFELELPRGTYTLQISHPDYQPVETAGFRVVANVGLATQVKLYPIAGSSSTALTATADEEVVVLGTYKPSENTVDLERFAVAITDAISIDELLRLGDSDVAASLRRLVGVSVTGGRYAIVRGLDGRYISSSFNGNLMPSTDPYRRDIQLDLFPSDILSGIEVQKTFSADLPGDTTGGNIKVKTLGMPTENFTKIGLSTGWVSGVTGKDSLTYQGGDGDRFTFDDGTRELPNVARPLTRPGASLSTDQRRAASLALNNILNPQSSEHDLNYGFSASLGRIFSLANGELGIVVVGAYDQESAAKQDAFEARDYFVALNPGQFGIAEPLTRYTEDFKLAKLTGYGAVTFESNAGWTVASKTTFLRDSEDSVRTDLGPSLAEPDRIIDRTTLEWVEREFIAQQFDGALPLFGGGHELTGSLAYFRTLRDAPDRRRYDYSNGRFSGLERNYSLLDEDGISLASAYAIDHQLFGLQSGTLRVGVELSKFDRTADVFSLLLSPTEIVDTGERNLELAIAESLRQGRGLYGPGSLSTDSYTADQTLTAAFVTHEADLNDAWNIVAGVRFEQYELDLVYPNQLSAGSLTEDTDALPSILVTYRLSDAWQLRGGYSKTISRPNITERSRSRFFDDEGRLIIGCLQAGGCRQAEIDNFDVRAEYYFNEADSISVAVFYKDITDPLELSLATRTADIRPLQYLNNPGATLQGIELDLNKRLSWDAWGAEIGANLSVIDSEVELGTAASQFEGGGDRELQGQSELLGNLRATLEHFATRQMVTLSANYFDDRIDRLGLGQEPSILEAGRLLINLNYEWDVTEALGLSAKVINLLNEPVEYTQGALLVERYETGTGVSAGISYQF